MQLLSNDSEKKSVCVCVCVYTHTHTYIHMYIRLCMCVHRVYMERERMINEIWKLLTHSW